MVESNTIREMLDSFPPVESTSGDYRFVAATSYDPPATSAEIANWEKALACHAESLVKFWRTTRSARLYYAEGSSGLTLLSPDRSVDETRIERELDEDGYHESDVVIGVFEVVSDQIIYSPEEGKILWAGTIDTREDWGRFDSIEGFLAAYRKYQYL